jgi:hypothetical protein
METVTPALFLPGPGGYVRSWLVTGPRSIPFTQAIPDEQVFRREAVGDARAEPPKTAELGAAGPFGEPWRFHYQGRNDFVEHSDFWTSPTVVDSYGWTEIEAERDGDVTARFWAAGTADLWVNGAHVTRLKVTRYMYPDYQAVTLRLCRGGNRLCVRLQAAAVRDTRVLFGLQLLGPGEFHVHVPGAEALTGPVQWLDSVKAEGADALVSGLVAPAPAEVILPDGSKSNWAAGTNRFSFGEMRPFQMEVKVTCAGQTFSRRLEIPANRNGLPDGKPGDVRRALLDYIASAPDDGFSPGANYSHLPLLARRILGRTSPLDAPSFATLIRYIDGRNDCSDFALAALLRMVRLGLATPAESAEIRRASLAFRYWDDEPGSDAMCFRSENHSLLFHSCQFIAGQLYPDEIFTNTGRKGRELIETGLERTRAWFDKIEAEGLGEFLSATYVPITLGALLNVADFSDDVVLVWRAADLLDQIYHDLADHAFHGLTVGPQGRVYRNVLYPEEGGTQALLAWATPEALPDFSPRGPKPKERMGDWNVFLASTKDYEPPYNLAERMRRPVSRRYVQGGAEIVLHKPADFILTSLAVPRLDSKSGLRPGAGGYQQHLWQATLGPGCHVFVNHPGCSNDVDKSARPAYWYGNGIVPVVRQRDEVLQAIFNIPDGSNPVTGRPFELWEHPARDPRPFDLHPIGFTHAHWPADAFEQGETRGSWVFGRKGTGCVGLWCSEKLQPWDDVLTGRELRAPGYRAAWAVVCGGLSAGGTFEAFMESCLARNPEFDREKLVLQMKGEEPLRWT